MVTTQTEQQTMTAIQYHRYGPPECLELCQLPRPAVGDDQVLVRVRAASVNPYDWHHMRGQPYLMRLMIGLRAPKSPQLGADMAGEVVAVGRNVTGLAPAEAVFGIAAGSFATYAVAHPKSLAPKPANLSFEQAAAVPLAGITAWQSLHDTGRLQPGQRVLINGAAGGVGTFAVQIARAHGAHVTGVCSTRNLELVRSLGATHVIDYTREDFTRTERHYDLLFDCVGSRSLRDCLRVLKPTGHYVNVGAPPGNWVAPLISLLRGRILGPFISQRVTTLLATLRSGTLLSLRERIEAGDITPVIDRRYALHEVPDAIRYSETGHARGKIVITMA